MRRFTILTILWLVGDVAVFLATYVLAYFARVGWILSTDFPFHRYFLIACAVAPFWLLVLVSMRTFALTRRQSSPKNGAYITEAAVIGIALFALAYYFTFGLFFSRRLLLYALVLSACGTWIWHMLYGQFMRHALRWNPPSFRALVIGVTRESQALIAMLNQARSPIMPVAVLDASGVKDREIHGVPVMGKLNRLEDVLREQRITHLIQCADLEQSLNLLSACRKNGITYMLLPSVLGIVERDERVEPLEDYQVTAVRPGGHWWQWFFR